MPIFYFCESVIIVQNLQLLQFTANAGTKQRTVSWTFKPPTQSTTGQGRGGSMVAMNNHTETVAESWNYTCRLHKVLYCCIPVASIFVGA
jgi:hypothetical protein